MLVDLKNSQLLTVRLNTEAVKLLDKLTVCHESRQQPPLSTWLQSWMLTLPRTGSRTSPCKILLLPAVNPHQHNSQIAPPYQGTPPKTVNWWWTACSPTRPWSQNKRIRITTYSNRAAIRFAEFSTFKNPKSFSRFWAMGWPHETYHGKVSNLFRDKNGVHAISTARTDLGLGYICVSIDSQLRYFYKPTYRSLNKTIAAGRILWVFTESTI